MKLKIALGVCLAVSAVAAVGAWPEAVFWSAPSNRAINQLDVSAHPLSLIWFWSLVMLPALISLTYTRSCIPVFLAMTTVLYHLTYLVWATFFFGRYGLAPGPLVWSVMLLFVIGCEFTFLARLKELRMSNNVSEDIDANAPNPQH